jgi:hypothetical protein
MFFPPSAAVTVFQLFAAVYVTPLLQQLWLSSCCSQLCMFFPPSAAVAVFQLFAAVYVTPLLQQLWLSSSCSQLCMLLPSFSSCGCLPAVRSCVCHSPPSAAVAVFLFLASASPEFLSYLQFLFIDLAATNYLQNIFTCLITFLQMNTNIPKNISLAIYCKTVKQ